MARSARSASGADSLIVEHEGTLWKPRPGATETFEAFAQARARFLEAHDHVSWNPWDRHLLQEAEEAFLAVRGQWTRAEPKYGTAFSRRSAGSHPWTSVTVSGSPT
jgi:hypothetical protein